MIEIAIKNSSGGDAGQAKIDEAILGGYVRPKVMHAAVVRHLANGRVGTHSAKTRTEIHGTTKKPWRQKGTGRARAGTRKSPIWRGGGVAHGPKPRDYSYPMPRKARRAALRSAMLAKLQDGEVVVVDQISIPEIKTKLAASLIASLGLVGKTTLIVTKDNDRNVHLSARNLPGVDVTEIRNLNTYGVLSHKRVLITQAALDAFCAADAPGGEAEAPAAGEGSE